MSDEEVSVMSEEAFEFVGDSDEEFDVAPTTKTGATKAVLKENNANVSKPSGNGGGRKKKTVEETYQKKTQLEHILLRPDTYIGSTEPTTQRMFVLDGDTIVEREITFTPGLFKIFDEIVVNAADNKQRDENMDRVEITVDPDTNTITVKNNGKGIPVVEHKEHEVYVPELIFGHLLTGSNFDDDEKKTTGGRNGYGAKLANVFSTQFTIECCDSEQGLVFQQTFTENMTVKGVPKVKKCTAAQKKKGDYVQISFCPDLKRFKMQSLDADTVALLSKRAYDIAGTMANSHGKKLSVFLNGKKLQVKSFKEYLSRFVGLKAPVVYEKNDRWEVAIAASPDSTMTHVSFVNAISTSKGGGHVTYIADQVVDHLKKTLKKKNKNGTEIKPAQIKNHLAIYVNCLVENPAFDSQTKDFLTTKPKSFGSECSLSDNFLKKVDKSEIVDAILAYAIFKDRQALKRKGGTKKTKLTGIAKLDDANFAGGAKSPDCTLIITEGDSAKSLAVSGLSVVGRDYYGVFPLRGKPLNVRDASVPQVMDNEEIKNLIDILGLKFDKQYTTDADVKTLRYGHLMVMADQDTDGSHIKGLVINFLHHFWPSLLDRPGFLLQFITPIVKASKGKQSKTFFNLPEYTTWLESTGNGGKGWSIKYYKGLGTSTSAEAKEYFSNLETHEIQFAALEDDKDRMEDDDDVFPDRATSGSDMIDMVFRKSRVEDRKRWLNQTPADTFLDYSTTSADGVRYSDFINKEYILFSRYDNIRSIPGMVDGFKPSQRKVLFGCFKRKLKGEVKVAQLTGYIAEHSAYHHGEVSLQGAIVGMAQNFCGSNNLNLLTPSGQFGTRRMGGKDAASARYIFTKLEPITRLIFHPDDDDLLTYLKDDGESIEPEFYVPVIPMVLVNGAEGIGTGWSSSVNNHDPRDIIENLRRKLEDGRAFEPMTPFYYGFTGDILPSTKAGSFSANGTIERVDDTTLKITELPLKKWTQDYKTFLEKFLNGDAKKPPEIKDFRENHTDTTVSFTITCEKEKIDEFEASKGGLMGKFKLTASLQSSNMHLFDEDGKIAKYGTTVDILTAFYNLRMHFYSKRKDMLLGKLRETQRKLSNKARFVEEVCSGELVVSNRKRTEILGDLKERGFETFFPTKKEQQETDDDENDNDNEDEEPTTDGSMTDAELAKGYEYLLGMKIWSLTFEKAEALRAELAEKTKALNELEATQPSQIWLNDLAAIESALDDRDEAFAEAQDEERKAQKKSQKRQQKVNKSKQKKTKKKAEWEDDTDTESEDPMEEEEASDEEVFQTKKVARKGKPASASVDDSLSARMQHRLHVSPPPKNPPSDSNKKRPPSPVLEDVEAKTSDVSPVSATAPSKQPRKAAAGKKRAPGKKVVEDLSDSEDEFDFQSDKEPETVAPAGRSRSARSRKNVVYAMDEDSDASF